MAEAECDSWDSSEEGSATGERAGERMVKKAPSGGGGPPTPKLKLTPVRWEIGGSM